MKVLAYSIRILTPLVVFCALASALPAGQYIELGTPDGLIIDQPMVSVVIQSTDGGGLFWPNGPSLQKGDDVWLLDTGAQTLLAAMEATGELVAEGFQTQVARTERVIGSGRGRLGEVFLWWRITARCPQGGVRPDR